MVHSLIDSFLDFVIGTIKHGKIRDNDEAIFKLNEYECLEYKRSIACYAYGTDYLNKRREPQRAAEIFQENCMKNKSADSCFHYGLIRCGQYSFKMGANEKRRFPEVNYAVALDYFDIACQLSKSDACYNAALFRLHGIRPTKDLGIPCELRTTPSSNKPTRYVSFEDGSFFVKTVDVPLKKEKFGIINDKDRKIMLNDLDVACSQGLNYACCALGVVYEKGVHDGSNKSCWEKAFKAYEIGCRRGNTGSCQKVHDLIIKKLVTGETDEYAIHSFLKL